MPVRFIKTEEEVLPFLQKFPKYTLTRTEDTYCLTVYLAQGDAGEEFPVSGDAKTLKTAALTLQTRLCGAIVNGADYYPEEHHVKCPVCGDAFRVDGHRIGLLPYCGCLGTDVDGETVPCEPCALKHILTCAKTVIGF